MNSVPPLLQAAAEVFLKIQSHFPIAHGILNAVAYQDLVGF
jgi:hypothetical protein